MRSSRSRARDRLGDRAARAACVSTARAGADAPTRDDRRARGRARAHDQSRARVLDP